MNSLPVAIALDPEPLDGPYRHYLVRRSHPDFPMEQRDECLCGYRSPWKVSGHNSTHPHGQVTVSRSDLTVLPHPSNLRVVR